MELDIFPMQGKLRNHRDVFGYTAVEKYLVECYYFFEI